MDIGSNEKRQQVFGIQELYCPTVSSGRPQIDIVAVHGLNGDAIRTWTTDKSKICWLSHPELLPKYIPNARVLTWGYNANILASSFHGGGSNSGIRSSVSSERIMHHAHSLIAQLCADREMEGASERPIIFLCHSLGGIIVKRALTYSESRTAPAIAHLHSIYTCTFGILFFGTPHMGSSKAHLLGSLQRIASLTIPKKVLDTDSSLVSALEEGSEVLQNITDQFAPLMSRFRIFFFWEQERTDLKFAKVDYIVNDASAAPILDSTERSGIAADHRGMCKFEGKNSPGFRTVIAALRRYSQDAPKTIQARRAAAGATLTARRHHEATELIQSIPEEFGRRLGIQREHIPIDFSDEFPRAADRATTNLLEHQKVMQ